MKGLRRGLEWRTCPISAREDSGILCYWDLRTDKDKKKLLNVEWLNINEEIVYVKVSNCTKGTDMRNSRTLINTRARAKGRNQHYVLSEIARLNKKQKHKSLTV